MIVGGKALSCVGTILSCQCVHLISRCTKFIQFAIVKGRKKLNGTDGAREFSLDEVHAKHEYALACSPVVLKYARLRGQTDSPKGFETTSDGGDLGSESPRRRTTKEAC